MTSCKELYIKDIMTNLADCFDYIVNDCNIPLDIFFRLFISTNISTQFESANPKYVSGMSGDELALVVCSKSGFKTNLPLMQIRIDKSPEYWCGWVLAYCQWKLNRSYASILEYVSIDEILSMYNAMHEVSEDHFVDNIKLIIERRSNKDMKLKQLRRLQGYSQRLLSEKSGVSLRAIQQYEQGKKDIHKAQVSSVKKLADSLGVAIDELL